MGGEGDTTRSALQEAPGQPGSWFYHIKGHAGRWAHSSHRHADASEGLPTHHMLLSSAFAHAVPSARDVCPCSPSSQQLSSFGISPLAHVTS